MLFHWVQTSDPIVTDEFKSELKAKLEDEGTSMSHEVQATAAISDLLPGTDGTTKVEPLTWREVRESDVTLYMEHLLTRSVVPNSGVRFTESTVRDIRSSLKSLFGDFKQEAVWQSVAEGLGRTFLAFRKYLRHKKESEGGSLVVGKEPLPFAAYMIFGEYFYSAAEGGAFAAAFQTLMWSLMARSVNIGLIKLDHVSQVGDALVVRFAHTKTDQTGQNRIHPRHVYANPLKPEICPVLALGVYWLVCNPEDTTKKLFKGSDQPARFRGVLHKGLDDRRDRLKRVGVSRRGHALHSYRKGASTEACTGSTIAPNSSAVSTRAGWSQGVEDQYKFPGEKQDQFVGRSVAGLPDEEFDILPPMFLTPPTEPDKASWVGEAMTLAFGNIANECDANFFAVLQMALASVVYHLEWLKDNTPEQHAWRFNGLMKDESGLLAKLRGIVWSGYDSGQEARVMNVKASGVPPHVKHWRSMQGLHDKADTVLHELRHGTTRNSGSTPEMSLPEQRGVDREILGEVRELRNDMRGLRASQLYTPVPPAASEALPEGFLIPRKLPLKSMWLMWRTGHGPGKVPPLSKVAKLGRIATGVRPAEVKLFDSLKAIMRTVDSVVMEKKGGLTQEELDTAKPEALITWWADGWQTLVELFNQTPRNSKNMRERRYDELSWSTWKGIGTTRKRQRQASRPQKRRRL